MKAKDLRERATEDLVELSKVMKKELFERRMKNFVNQLDDTSLLGKTRRDLARIELILSERKKQQGAEAASGGEKS